METQTRLFDIIFNEDEITWKTMIYKLVKEEGMDPWNIEISSLAQKFLLMLKELKKMDFRVSGKVILAAAILLRIKSKRLVGEDFNNLNRLIAMSEDSDDEFYEELEGEFVEDIDMQSGAINLEGEDYSLTPRTPLPRKRKVSVYDLVDALHQALEVKKRRKNRLSEVADEPELLAPIKKKDISIVIGEIYDEIQKHFFSDKVRRMMFSELVSNEAPREAKVTAFMPLLYLDNQRKIDLFQESHLGDIEIALNKNPPKVNETIEPEAEEQKTDALN